MSSGQPTRLWPLRGAGNRGPRLRRLVRVLLVLALAAGVFAGVARALDFNDEGDNAPVGEVGKVYRFEMPSHGGCDYAPYRYVVESGELPPGVKLGSASNLVGLVDGMPTESGIFRAWIALKDVCGNSAELLFTFEVWVRRWEIETQSLKPATVGSPYSIQLAGKGVPSNVTWEITQGTLPAGLTLSSGGVISGTPTAVGTASFTVRGTAVGTDPASDGTRIDSKQFTLAVAEPLAVRASRLGGEVGVPSRAVVAGLGGQGPYTWSATGLPAGLTLGSGGAISGTPSTPGSYRATITMTDANGSTKTSDVTFTVAPRLVITTRSLPIATIGTPYTASLVAGGGVRPVRWTLAGGRLPAGLKLAARTGKIIGTARAARKSRVTIRVRDAVGGAATKTFVVSARG
jgi:large repetitive protein